MQINFDPLFSLFFRLFHAGLTWTTSWVAPCNSCLTALEFFFLRRRWSSVKNFVENDALHNEHVLLSAGQHNYARHSSTNYTSFRKCAKKTGKNQRLDFVFRMWYGLQRRVRWQIFNSVDILKFTRHFTIYMALLLWLVEFVKLVEFAGLNPKSQITSNCCSGLYFS